MYKGHSGVIVLAIVSLEGVEHVSLNIYGGVFKISTSIHISLLYHTWKARSAEKKFPQKVPNK